MVFREVNERVAELANGHWSGEPALYSFFCECPDTACLERVELTLGEYESLRAQPTWFVVAPGHAYPQIEQVVRKNADHQIVQKLDDAGDLAAANDPRV